MAKNEQNATPTEADVQKAEEQAATEAERAEKIRAEAAAKMAEAQAAIDEANRRVAEAEAKARVAEERASRGPAPEPQQAPAGTPVVVSPDDYRARMIAESMAIAATSPLDLVERPVYLVAGEYVDANGNPTEPPAGDRKSVEAARAASARQFATSGGFVRR